MERPKLKGHAALLVANVIWGLNAPIGKGALLSAANPEGIAPQALTLFRMVGACALFWLLSLFTARERVAPRHLMQLFFASLFGVQINQMLFLWGLSLTSPIDVSIICTITPIVTMVLAMLFLGEPITRMKAGGVALGAAGAVALVLLTAHDAGQSSSLAGNVICLMSALSYSVYLTACRDAIVRYTPVTTMKWMFLFASIVSVAVFHPHVVSIDYAALPPRVIGSALYVITLSTFLAYMMVPVAQRVLRPTVVSMYNYLQPLVAVLFTVAVGLDTLDPLKAAAALSIFLGVWLVTRSKARSDMHQSAK